MLQDQNAVHFTEISSESANLLEIFADQIWRQNETKSIYF